MFMHVQVRVSPGQLSQSESCGSKLVQVDESPPFKSSRHKEHRSISGPRFGRCHYRRDAAEKVVVSTCIRLRTYEAAGTSD